MSTPSIRIFPEVASSNPASSLSNVDLPQPELPRIANSSLRRMSRETPSTAATPSKRFVSSWICTRGAPAGSRAPLPCRAWSAVCFEPPFALSFTVGSQACLDARPQPRSQALFLRAVQVSLVQRVADFVRRVNGGVVAYLGKQEWPRLAVRRRIARLVADRRDHLGPQQVIEKQMCVVRMGRVGRDEPQVEPRQGSFARRRAVELDAAADLPGAPHRLRVVARPAHGDEYLLVPQVDPQLCGEEVADV